MTEKSPNNRIAVLDGGYDSYEYEKDLFLPHGYTFEIEKKRTGTRAEQIEFVRGAAGLMVRDTVIDGEFLDAVPGIRAIVRYGVGYDNIDVAAASGRGIRVANVQSYANHSVSDHALALMYSCVRCLPRGGKTLVTHFGQPPVRQIFELHDKTLGIIGLGQIGGTLCRKTQLLFHRILASDPYIPEARFEELGAKPVDLDTLLVTSDVISVHCNLTSETRRLLNRRAFSLMERHPVLVNTARGSIVDENALLDALDTGIVSSAGLDVFDKEPPLSNKNGLLAHPAVMATGHYAWYSDRAAVDLQRRAADNMLALLQGRLPDDCLNK